LNEDIVSAEIDTSSADETCAAGFGQVGIVFLIPGVDEALRLNGRATLPTDPVVLATGVPALVARDAQRLSP